MTGSSLIRKAVAAIGLLLLLAMTGCANRPEPASVAIKPIKHSAPADWIGRWVGTSQTFYLQLLPTARRRHYRLTLRDSYVRARSYKVKIAADQQGLVFMRGGKRMTISAGSSDQARSAPELAGLDNCLILRADDASAEPKAFCRRPASVDALPVNRGTYVLARQECWDAMPDDMLYFNGQGLTRGRQQLCHASLISQQGIVFSVAENCTDPVSHQRTTEEQTITVADDHQFALQAFGGDTHLYGYCPGKPIPGWVTPPTH